MKSEFSIDQSKLAKGLFIIFLLFHHLFYGENVEEYQIRIFIKNLTVYKNLVIYARICISGFAFISAYGISQKIKKIFDNCNFKDLFKISLKRFLKLEAALWVVYVFAILYKRFVMHESIRQAYMDVKGIFRPVYLLIDALGMADFMHTPSINVTWWFFSFAILLVFVVPIFYMVYHKLRYFAFPLMMICFPHNLYGIVVLAVAFSYENWFEKLNMVMSQKKWKMIGGVCCLFLVFFSYQIVAGTQTIEYVQGWIGALWVWICLFYFDKIPIFNTILKFIGKHSANIFMVHTFVYYYFYTSYIYSFQKDYIICLALLAITLGISVIIEALKKICRYNDLVEYFSNKITEII